MGFLDNLKSLFGPKQGQLPIANVAKRFELLGRTGQGSMSKVWRARDKKLGRTICLKILDKPKTAKFDARFPGLKKPSEGVICMGLRHRNIVQTFEHGMTTDKEQYLVMELIEGMGLNFLVETRSKQLEGNGANFLAQIAEGLAYLHKQGFLHRDICPRNVMATNTGQIKLIDFGLAVPFTPDFCRPGNRTGTLNYMAPELIKRTTTDHRVDLFALGVTAYEVLTGNLPWDKAESLQVLLSHMNSPARDPQELRKGLDKRTAAFLIKSVERDPRDRYQSAEEFRDAVKALPIS